MPDGRIFKGPAEVVTILGQLGLDRERLMGAVRSAGAERAPCTRYDRKGWPLIVTGNKAARALRELFCGERWISDETDNQAGILNPHINVRVIPFNFDENAGNPLADPPNRKEKGSASEAKTLRNAAAWLPGLNPSQPGLTMMM